MNTTTLLAGCTLALTVGAMPASAAVTFDTLDYDVQASAVSSDVITIGSPGGMGEIASLPSAPISVINAESSGSTANLGTSAAYASAALIGDFANASTAELEVAAFGYQRAESG